MSQEREALLEEGRRAPVAARRRKRGGCQYWVAPSIVVVLIVYGLVVSFVGALWMRLASMWAAQILLSMGFLLGGWMMAVSFYKAVFTEPGYNESNEFLELPAYAGRPKVDPERPEEVVAMDAVRWCKKCKLYKPDRTHHCSNAGACVLRMDHYCPWVNQTVGQRNHKFFFLFLFWGTILCTYACVVLLLTLALTSPSFDFDLWTVWDWQAAWVMFYTGVFALTLLVFGGQHLGQILVNCTTLESFKSVARWNRGSKRENWREVMGDRNSLVPTDAVGIGDGYLFGAGQHEA
jgi:hypothetical protein